MARATTTERFGGPPEGRARVAALLAAAALALACGSRAPAAPRPTSITPDRGAAGAAVSVRIAGEAFGAAVSADFVGDGGDVIDARYQAFLGTVPLDDVALRQDGTLAATVPADLALGVHDLTVVDPAGRTGTLPGPYRVLASLDAAAAVARFRVEPVAAQIAYAPFTVVVTALDVAGAVVADFSGEVQLSDATGTAVPSSLGLFSGGRWTGAVEVRAPRAGDVLTVTLPGAATGASAPFDVSPPPAVAVRFVTPALQVQAGACAGPVTVSLRDAFGLETTAAAPVTAAVAATSAGVTLYADAACTVSAGGAVVDPGQGEASFWIVATAAGPLQLSASAPFLSADSLIASVRGGPPAALAFVTAPQTAAAGVCSGVATVQLLDAYGNPAAPSAAATSIAVAGPGLTLFADAACAGGGVSSVAVPAGATTASLSFRGAGAGPTTVTASAAGVASASQTETIVAATATQLAFTTAPQTVSAGACSGVVTLEARDAWGNAGAVSPPAPTSISITGMGVAVHAGAGCGGAAVTSVTLAAGATSTTLSFVGTTAGAAAVTATAAGLSGAGQGATIVAGEATRLAFATAAQSVTAGNCSGAVTVETLDAWGNPAVVSSTVTSTVALSAPGLTLHAGTGCAGGAVAAVELAAGTTAATFSFAGTTAGTSTIGASASGLSSASQVETISAGPTDHYVWSTLATPQTAGVAFAATITAVDAYGNRKNYAGTATLTASSGTVSCATACTSASETASFSDGQWTGTLVAPAAATGLTLTVTGSGRTGTSNAFDVLAPAGRSPPVARFTASARVITSGNSVTFDASGSTDGQTPASALAVSWHLEALDADFASATAPDASPWTAWTTTRTATHAFLNHTAAPIIYRPRLAVRDAEAGPGGPDVGFATETIVVLPDASNICVVDTDSLVDDNGWSGSCDVKGTDGRTSLAEAVRIANGSAAPLNILFSGTRNIVGGQTFWMNTPVRILADPGAVVLDGVSLALNATGILVSGLEFTRLTTPIVVADSSEVRLEDLHVHDGAGIEVRGQARVVRARMSGCTGVACVYENGWGAYLALFSSDLQGPGTGVGVSFATCASATPGVTGGGYSPYRSFLNGWSDTGSAFVAATVLSGFDVAVSGGTAITCPHPVIANVTFDRNGTGVRRGDAGGYVLDSVFTNHAVAAVDPAGCAFDQLARNLTWQNATDGCLASSTGLLAADPLFVDAAGRDYRLRYASPAKDAGSANGTEVDDAGPGLYLGAAPDRGGRETW